MVHYRPDFDGVTPSDLRGFFVGWPKPPSPETHLRILRQSTYVVLAIDDETGQVVGFVNAISDGILSAYIPLLEVLPEYQHRGIGRTLMEKMLEQLSRLYMIDLTCDENLQQMYAKFGFRPMTAMMIRDFQNQAGRKPQ